MDFEDMERKIPENKLHAAIFRSPHIPCQWMRDRWEIEKAIEPYKKSSPARCNDINLLSPHAPIRAYNPENHERPDALHRALRKFSELP